MIAKLKIVAAAAFMISLALIVKTQSANAVMGWFMSTIFWLALDAIQMLED